MAWFSEMPRTCRFHWCESCWCRTPLKTCISILKKCVWICCWAQFQNNSLMDWSPLLIYQRGTAWAANKESSLTKPTNVPQSCPGRDHFWGQWGRVHFPYLVNPWSLDWTIANEAANQGHFCDLNIFKLGTRERPFTHFTQDTEQSLNITSPPISKNFPPSLTQDGL